MKHQQNDGISNEEAVKRVAGLLENRADVTITDNAGHTALQYAVYITNHDMRDKIARLLVHAGANIQLATGHKSTLLQIMDNKNIPDSKDISIEELKKILGNSGIKEGGSSVLNNGTGTKQIGSISK